MERGPAARSAPGSAGGPGATGASGWPLLEGVVPSWVDSNRELRRLRGWLNLLRRHAECFKTGVSTLVIDADAHFPWAANGGRLTDGASGASAWLRSLDALPGVRRGRLGSASAKVLPSRTNVNTDVLTYEGCVSRAIVVRRPRGGGTREPLCTGGASSPPALPRARRPPSLAGIGQGGGGTARVSIRVY